MNLIRYFLVVVLAMFLSACGGGGGSAGNPGGVAPIPPVVNDLFTTAPGSLTTVVGAAQEFSISGGTSPYTAASDNATIATASINGSSLTIGGVASGIAGVLVRDARGASVAISVTVKSATLRDLFTTAASKLVVSIGSASAQTYVVGGGTAPYTVTSSNAGVVSVGLTGNNMTLTGLSAGTANILVRDNTGASITLEVTVQPASVLFTTAAGGVTVAVGTSPVYSVGGGTGPYTASSSNTSVATTSFLGNALTINGTAAGTANVVVRDSAGASTSVEVKVQLSTPLFTTAAGVTVSVGSAPGYAVGGGIGPYTATSSNSSVAAVSLVGSTLTITGIAAGSTNIVVRDSSGATTTAAVTVQPVSNIALFTTAAGGVTVTLGATSIPSYTVGGGAGPYTATSSNTSVAAVLLSGNLLTVTGVAPGSVNILVRDSVGATITVPVTVQPAGNLPLFTTVPASGVTVAVGPTSSQTYNVGGGSGSGYLATSTNTGVVTVELANIAPGAAVLKLTGVAVGSANVVVRDSLGGLVNVSVTVGTIPLAVTPNNATAIVQDVLKATVTGGTPPYKPQPSVGNTIVASASIIDPVTNEFTITLLQSGITTVTVFDNNNQSVAFTVTSSAPTPGTRVRLSPSAVTVSESDTKAIEFTVFGAAPGVVNVFSSDVTKLTASITGNLVTVNTVSGGNRCVSADLPVTITVIDSIRANATATITIKDNGNRRTADPAATPPVAADPCPP